MGNLPCHGLLGASWSKPYLWSGQSLNFTASQNTSSVRHVKNSLCQPSQFVNQKNEALKDLITSPNSTWVRARSCFMFCLVHMGKLCVSHLCPILCDPVDYSPPGSSVHGIPHARILEWVAIPFSRGSAWPMDRTSSPALQADSLLSEPPAGKPQMGKRDGKEVEKLSRKELGYLKLSFLQLSRY